MQKWRLPANSCCQLHQPELLYPEETHIQDMSKELFLWENYIPRKMRKNLLTLKLPLVTKTEFLLNTSIQYQADKR